ncbi:MAG TPA: hypothetical protein ENK49_01440, partial [Gammaproteobacteria bacterium]|nr:hypothetical protein [Gammaproteobacteria bacterium]
MNDPLPRLSPSQTSGRFRNHRPVIMMLAVICHFTALPATADECTRLPAPAGGKLADFDQAILPLKSRRNLERHIRDDLCAKQNIYAFLTGETAYRYGGCFIPAREADGFWNANHQQSESLLWRFRTHCIHWAEKRYQSRLARLDTGERRSQKKKSLPGADRAPVKASRTQPPGGRQAAQAQKPPSRQQAITAALESHSGSKLQWPGAPARAQQSNPELAAYLFATELLNPGGETEAAAGHLQQHFDTMMGRPQVLSVTATGRDREYQV